MLRAVFFLSVAVSLALGGPVVTEEVLCDICIDVVNDLDAAVSDGKLHARVVGKLTAVCDMVTPDRTEECSNVVSSLMQDVLHDLMQHTKPVQLCEAMTVCPAHTDLRTQQQQQHQQHQQQQQLLPRYVSVGVNNDTCALCEYLVQTIDVLIKNKTTPAAANETAYKICDALPEPLKDTCVTFIPLIVDMIIDGVDPVGACTNMGLCLVAPVPVLKSRRIVETNAAEPVTGDATCQLCELLVRAADQYLQENQTEAAINTTIYNLCSDLPSPLNDTCVGFAPLVVKELAQGVDPKKACSAIKLCTNSSDDRIVERQAHNEPVTGDATCQLCELLVQAADQYLEENQTVATINTTIYNLCSDLPSPLNDTCMGFAPLVVKELSQGVDPKRACTAVKLCTNSSAEVRIPERQAHNEQPVTGDATCQLCELLVQAADQYLQENQTEAAINTTIYNLCSDLPSPLNNTCVGFAPLVVKELTQGADPKRACTAIKLCTNSLADVVVAERQANTEPVTGDATCQLCELLVQAADQYLEENQTVATINTTIYNLCSDLPSPLNDTCMGFAPLVVKELVQGVDPQKACTAIKLCTNSSADVRIPQRRPDLSAVRDSIECQLCELLVQSVDKYLQENKTEAAINATIYNLCNDLPAAIKTTCLGFAPLVVQKLSQGVDPKLACTAIGLCTGSSTVAGSPRRDVQHLDDSPVCQLCELLVQTVDQYLQDNKTEAAINATVYNLCNDFPAPLNNTCLSFAPLLVQKLSQGFDPKQACTAVTLCTSSSTDKKRGTLLSGFLPQIMKDDMLCTFCKDHIDILDQDLYRDEAGIQGFLDGICHRLPPPTDQACLTAADTKFPEIYENFLNGTASPDNVCKLLKVCTN